MDRIYLDDLRVDRFRNLNRIHLSPDARFNVISGKNGSGKTNLLEAIYFFSALRSFRTVSRQELIQKDAENARLKGVFKGAAAGMEADIELSPKARKIRKGGKEVTSIAAHFSELPMVLFHPANMALIQGGPKERRRFMDRALFQADNRYPVLSGDYQRALQSRNQLLKSGQGAHPAVLGPYDKQLATLGAQMVKARHQFIAAASSVFEKAFESISLGLGGSIAYKPDVKGEEEEMLRALNEAFERDSRRGYTSKGPHADDLEVIINGMPAKRFASQGQQRLAVLSLKIAETVALQASTERIPIMLLDDISSELDRDRNRELFGFLRRVGGQVFITTTHLDHVLIDSDRSDFEIRNGAFE